MMNQNCYKTSRVLARHQNWQLRSESLRNQSRKLKIDNSEQQKTSLRPTRPKVIEFRPSIQQWNRINFAIFIQFYPFNLIESLFGSAKARCKAEKDSAKSITIKLIVSSGNSRSWNSFAWVIEALPSFDWAQIQNTATNSKFIIARLLPCAIELNDSICFRMLRHDAVFSSPPSHCDHKFTWNALAFHNEKISNERRTFVVQRQSQK